MAVTIRPATLEDARPIAEVHVASWRWAYRDILPAAVLDGLSVHARADMWMSILDEPLGRSLVSVAADGETVVGVASAGPSRKSDTSDGTAEVFTLYLLEPVAGLGVGRALFRTLMASVREHGYTRAVLWVLEANERARRFYEAAGWRYDGARDMFQVEGGDYPEVRYGIAL